MRFLRVITPLLLAICCAVTNACDIFVPDLVIGADNSNYIDLSSQASFSIKFGFTASTCPSGQSSIQITLPDGTNLQCSSVGNSGAAVESVCPITHAQMLAGSYFLTLVTLSDGLAYGGPFFITNTQATSTATTTPTVTVSITTVVISSTTISTTETDTTTLAAATITSPVATSGTLIIRPILITTVTKSRTKTSTSIAYTTVTSTKTTTPHCTKTAVSAPMKLFKGKTKSPLRLRHRSNAAAAAAEKRSSGNELAKRDGPDGPLTTTITITASPYVSTVIAATSTLVVTNTDFYTTLLTATPVAVTVFAGTVPVTITAPTKTRTSTVRVTFTTTKSKTITRTARLTVTAPTPTCSVWQQPHWHGRQ